MKNKTTETELERTRKALDDATNAHAAALEANAKANAEFEADPTSQVYERVVTAERELAFRARLLTIAQSRFDAAEVAERKRLEAEAEAKRLARLAEINAEVSADIAAASECVRQIAEFYGKSAKLALEAQSLKQGYVQSLGPELTRVAVDRLIDLGLAGSAMAFR